MTNKRVLRLSYKESDLEAGLNLFYQNEDASGWRIVSIYPELIPGSDRASGMVTAWLEFEG